MKHATKLKIINDDTMQAKYHFTRYNGEIIIPTSESKLPIQIVRMKELTVILGLSRSCIYNKINSRSKWYDETFPRPRKIGPGAVGWLLTDILNWLQSLS